MMHGTINVKYLTMLLIPWYDYLR